MVCHCPREVQHLRSSTLSLLSRLVWFELQHVWHEQNQLAKGNHVASLAVDGAETVIFPDSFDDLLFKPPNTVHSDRTTEGIQLIQRHELFKLETSPATNCAVQVVIQVNC
ncbi:hypothetical protein NE237_029614 [Protea cynaroides]|uniref:Uncharacterized protein n=1 Tax=Protea cynaroides TaxID=273540 RepID=A0A9Q0GVM1_9MAGN|nr:hypothetical protein NE237_029614 [Protea cynaroides]